MAQVATLVAQKRAAGGEVVLLDDGDSLQGQPTVYYYNFLKTDVPHIWGEVLNYLKYDVVGVGNHDIEAGHPVYDKLVKEVKAPVICANIVKEGTDEPYFKPYAIITRQGVKIAILGIIEPKITEQLPNAFWSGMDVLDMVETAKKWVPIIQEKEKPDLLVGLFHAGVDYTYGGQNADTPSNENASQLVAEQVARLRPRLRRPRPRGLGRPGLRPRRPRPRTSTSRIPPARSYRSTAPLAGAQNVAVVNVSLTWDKETKSWTKTITGALVPLKGVAADAAFLAKFEPAKAELKAWVERPDRQDGRQDHQRRGPVRRLRLRRPHPPHPARALRRPGHGPQARPDLLRRAPRPSPPTCRPPPTAPSTSATCSTSTSTRTSSTRWT